MEQDLDRDVRLSLYRFFVDRGRPPSPPEIADNVGAPAAHIEAALQRLHDAHVIVLAPGSTSVWMANPLSAVPTPFQVDAGERTWFGNCIWDALGIPPMLGKDGRVRTWCPDCTEPMSLELDGGRVSGEGIIHFAVPAARWWEDIGHT